MIARMIVTGLVTLSLSFISRPYSINMARTAPETKTPPAHIQQSQPAGAPTRLRIFIQEDFSFAQRLRSELADWANRIAVRITFVEKEAEPYDLRIILASDVGSGDGSCTSPCSSSCPESPPISSSCRITVTLHFVSAAALTPDGKLLFTETGIGNAERSAMTPLARKLAKRISVLPGAKSTPAR
jgi:hypothetical protein